MHLLIYTPRASARLHYIFGFIFHEILKTTFEVTTHPAAFSSYDGPKMAYAPQPVDDGVFFKSTNLLFETKIVKQTLETIKFGEISVPFPVNGSALPFDLFAASFYIVSRYEEYVFSQHHQRNFTAEDSFQNKHTGLTRPVVDGWSLLLKNILLKRFPNLHFAPREFVTMPTVHLQPMGEKKRQSIISLLKMVLNKKNREELFDVATGLGDNQEESLTFLSDLFKKKRITPFYFLSLNHQNGSKAFERFAQVLRSVANIGIFTRCSDGASDVTTQLPQFEKLAISNNAVVQQIDDFTMPACYLQLLKNGIYTDFSMGYIETCGFRAGTCTPFYWYDLQLEKQTTLKIYPYAISGNALQQLFIDPATLTYQTIIDRIKLVNGTFVSVWHLKNLQENSRFKKWRALYLSMINYAGNGEFENI